MQTHPGLFVVIEGADGSGKTTQFDLLHNRLKKAGYDVEIFKFPRYDKASSHFVKRYLNGDYGPASQINPYAATLFYAMDRYEAGPEIKKALNAGKIVLSDRYIGSNMAHQGGKFKEPIEKRSFFVWEDSIEYQLLGIPRADINIFLRVPAEVSFQLIGQRAAREYTKKSHDEHEGDIDHLRNSVQTYDLLCQLFPKDFKAVECAPDSKLLPIDQISELVWSQVSPILPALEAPQAAPVPTPQPTPAEPSSEQKKWQIDSLSLLAAYELKRLAPHLQIEPVWSGPNPSFNYYIPSDFSSGFKRTFIENMGKMIGTHKELRSKLKNLSSDNATTIAKLATPLAALTSAELILDSESALKLFSKTSQSQNKEVTDLSAQLRQLIKDSWPKVWQQYSADGKNVSMPKAISEIIEKLSADIMPQNIAQEGEAVKLVEASPRNEFDLLVDSLYPYSNLSRPEIAVQLEKWNYQQKLEVLQAALAKPPAEILKIVNYNFDIMADRIVLDQMLDNKIVSDVQLQLTTPRYGYEVPHVLEDNNADIPYIELFDQSLELYSEIQQQSDGNLMEYAALSGHRLRWQATINAHSLASSKLVNSPIVQQVIDKIKEVHPILGEHLLPAPTQTPAPKPKTAVKAAPKTEAKPKPPAKRSRNRRKKAK